MDEYAEQWINIYKVIALYQDHLSENHVSQSPGIFIQEGVVVPIDAMHGIYWIEAGTLSNQ